MSVPLKHSKVLTNVQAWLHTNFRDTYLELCVRFLKNFMLDVQKNSEYNYNLYFETMINVYGFFS